MNTVLVTGGTGHLGRLIVALLKARGDRIRILARRPGQDPDVEWVQGDLGTGSGVADAVPGVDTVIHAATNSPAAQRGALKLGDFFRSPRDVDIHGTRALLTESARNGVRHFLHVSIIGVQQARAPYQKVKAEAENIVRAGDVPWSIVPGAPFHWLLGRMFDQMAGKRLWPVPANLAMQPADEGEFAEYVMECLADGPAGLRDGFAGPEVLTMADAARRYQRARGASGRILGLRLPGFMVRAAGPQTCPDCRLGKITWADWLARDPRH